MSIAEDSQIRSLDGLVGHTIKAVIQKQGRKREVDLVIVTETGCWLALYAQGGSHDEAATLNIDPPYFGSNDVPLADYLSAQEVFDHGLANLGTYEFLKAKEEALEAFEKKAKVESLRKQLEELEGGGV